MNEILQHLTTLLHREDGGFVIGRVALAILIVAVIIVAAIVALVIPN